MLFRHVWNQATYVGPSEHWRRVFYCYFIPNLHHDTKFFNTSLIDRVGIQKSSQHSDTNLAVLSNTSAKKSNKNIDNNKKEKKYQPKQWLTHKNLVRCLLFVTLCFVALSLTALYHVTMMKMAIDPLIAFALSCCVFLTKYAKLAQLWQKIKQLQVKDDAIGSFKECYNWGLKETPETHVTVRRVMKSPSKQSPSQENTDDDRTFWLNRTVGRRCNSV